MTPRTGRFRRADRLLESRDFRRVGRVGERFASRYFVVLLAPCGPRLEGARGRLGVTVSRRVGNAVVRNRIKRGVREWYRQRRGDLEPGLDLLVIARKDAGGLSSREIAGALDEASFRLWKERS